MSDSYEDKLRNLKEKSEDDYEKNITYISAGSLALTTTFLSDIISIERSHCFAFVIISWTMLALTLISNLASHLYSSYIMDKCRDDKGRKNAVRNWKRRTLKIRIWNIVNIITLMCGIAFFIIFISVNIPAMAKK